MKPLILLNLILLHALTYAQTPAKAISPQTKQFVSYWKQIANLSGDLADFKKQTGVNLQPKLDEASKKSLPKLYEAFDGLLHAAMGDNNSQQTITEKFSLKAMQNISGSVLNNSAYSPIPVEDENKPLPLMPNDEALAVKTFVTPDLKHTLPENRTNLVDYNMNLRLAKVEAADSKAFYDEVTTQLKFSIIIYKKWVGDYQLSNRNLLLFVNGYRSKIDLTLTEYPNSNNKVYTKDVEAYWEGIDSKFIDRISTKNTIYADGHHTVATANHLSQLNFGYSMSTSEVAAGTISSLTAEVVGAVFDPLLADKIISHQVECFHNEECVKLNTTPNVDGFNQRRENGRLAGQDLYEKLINGTIPCRKAMINGELKIQDTIDVVCHSMGFAYTLGILDELKTKIAHFGWLYCLAPENACSGEIPLNNSGQVLFDEIWQYGSNEFPVAQGGDPLWEQDGIAPQCGIKGLDLLTDRQKYGRIYIPKDSPKDFLACHKVVNYKWIFDKKANTEGYVKKRN